MATATRTSKQQATPFTLSDHLTAWWTKAKCRTRKRFRKLYHQFLVSSTVAFWAMIAGYVFAKGWIG